MSLILSIYLKIFDALSMSPFESGACFIDALNYMTSTHLLAFCAQLGFVSVIELLDMVLVMGSHSGCQYNM